uniref:Cytochrome P450 n=1 Tax=Glossina morsitans morsitans TaxID=37546 RepID=A0A1B0FBI7_GLOMM
MSNKECEINDVDEKELNEKYIVQEDTQSSDIDYEDTGCDEVESENESCSTDYVEAQDLFNEILISLVVDRVDVDVYLDLALTTEYENFALHWTTECKLADLVLKTFSLLTAALLSDALEDISSERFNERLVAGTCISVDVATNGCRNIPHPTSSLGEYLVPAGTTALIMTYMLHRNLRFNPDNFLPENCIGRHPFAYIPPSAGPRHCIGKKFAILEEKTVLRKFKIEAVDRPEDLTLLSELILRPKGGLRIKITNPGISYT